jgi:hypothetical protein
MKLKLLASLFILSSLAWGQRQHQTQQQQQNVNNTTTNSHNNTSDSTATGGDSSGQSTSFNSQEIRQTPPAFAPDAYPTAPCRVAGSAGGSSPYFGLSIGGSKLDKDCAKRELARLLLAAGQRQAAVSALCSTEAAKGIQNCTNLEQGPTPEPVRAIEPTAAPIIVPAPQVTINPTVYLPLPEPLAPTVKRLVKKRAGEPCVVQKSEK